MKRPIIDDDGVIRIILDDSADSFVPFGFVVKGGKKDETVVIQLPPIIVSTATPILKTDHDDPPA